MVTEGESSANTVESMHACNDHKKSHTDWLNLHNP